MVLYRIQSRKRIALGLALGLLSGCAHAQQNIPTPAVITPKLSGTAAAGKLYIPKAVNGCGKNDIVTNIATCDPVILTQNMLDGSNVDGDLTIKGSTTTSGRILLLPQNAGSTPWVEMRAVASSGAALMLIGSGSTGTEENGVGFRTAAGTEYLRISILGTHPYYQGYDTTHYFENASVLNPTMEIENLASGYELKIGTRTGVLKASSGNVTEITGTSSHCIKVDASSGVCDTPDPAWTSYTPTVTSSGGGTLTPVSVNAAYLVNGKTVFVRINWAGSWSSTPTELQFTTPVDAKIGGVQPIYGVVSEAGALQSTYSYAEPTLIRVAKISGATFAAGANLIMTFTGVYEAD